MLAQVGFCELTDHAPHGGYLSFCFVLLLPPVSWPLRGWLIKENEHKSKICPGDENQAAPLDESHEVQWASGCV